ncbi:MAG: NAD(P)H-quinone oxidoreductase [Clostridia bacterium]
MKAILTMQDKSLVWADVETPVPRDDEVLVCVKAAALNRADLMQRAGDYPPPPGCPEWMGLEISGVIEEVGSEAKRVSTWKKGDKVCALLGGGGYAEYVTVRYDMLMPIPKGLTMVQAAALPEAFATAYVNLFIEGDIKAGETLLMNAGASGLASVIIPMAKAFGARVITTVLSDEIAASITHLGADVVVNTRGRDIVQVLEAEAANGHPLDVAIDCLGGDAVAQCMPHMNRGGRWIMIATLAGDTSAIDLKMMYKKNLRLTGNTLRARTPAVKAWILASLVKDIWPKVEAGLVTPTIYKVLPMQKAEEAHAILQRGENIGKVVMTVEE